MRDNRNSSTLSLIGIYEISKLLTGSFNLEKTLRDVVNLLSSYLEMRRGMISLVGTSNQLEAAAAAGMTPDATRRDDGRAVPPVANQVLASGMPVVIHDLAQEAEPGNRNDLSAAILDGEVVAMIGVPIKDSGKTVGVLTVERIREEGRRHDVNFEADVRFLTMVANLVGQTVRLHNAVAFERERLILEKHRLQKAVSAETRTDGFSIDNLVGRSRRIRSVYAELHQVAASRSTVLLRGESGTGKELAARAVHHLSPRKDGPFIKVNCAALTETLLESELFGHEKGAFTGANAERKGRFEQANGGTLFLDEIGEISGPFQAKLLRVLQEGEFERVGGNKTIKVDVRLLCATNRNLEEMVAKGEFRADLYYRINVVPVFMPPLRERKGDIPLLASHFLGRFNAENGRNVQFSDETLKVLMNCYFPGNVRELENCVYRVATTARGDIVDADAMPCQMNQCLSATLWNHAKTQGDPRCPSVSGQLCGAGDKSGTCPEQGTIPPGIIAACVEARSAGAASAASAAVSAVPAGDVRPAMGGAMDRQRETLLQAMEKAGWVQAKAARLLNLTPRQIGYALKKYNIEVKRL
ncbi:MAG: nif-specific transcriptional activator NifA [Rhodospirillaceae bacterium]|nr:nif-specific transcriptional activator NifA [Rhodospirillaceae bacterium]